jgi:hypothetical protein
MIFDKASDGKRGARKPVSSGHFVVEPTGASFAIGLEHLGLVPDVETWQEVRPHIVTGTTTSWWPTRA